jgi:hypothetical protein
MPITTDFLLLYEDLKVTPECSVDHFKRAYRRRVGELHPDRTSDPASTARLQTLTRLHDEAMRFHERHGRLPGANQMPQSGASSDVSNRSVGATETMASFSAARGILIGVIVVAIVALAWLLFPPDEATDQSTEPGRSSMAEADSRETSAPILSIGMDESGVRRVQGEPAFLSADRWEYGPSYVRFERHRVVGWYSSPVYPLKTGTTRHNSPVKSSD